MSLPFTAEQFLDVFARYNQAVSPAQWLLYGLGLVAVFLAVRPAGPSDKLISLILALLWLWAGVLYHLAFFTTINSAAYIFGAMFIAQAGMFLWVGVFQSRLSFRLGLDGNGASGAVVLCSVLLLYPMLAYLLGHRYPATPTFGLPCPTTIFTLGLLLCSAPRVPLYLLVFPTLWAVVGLLAALQLGMYEDLLLLIAVALSSSVWLCAKARSKHEVAV